MSAGTPKGYAFSDAWNLFKKTTLKLAPAVVVLTLLQIALEMTLGEIGSIIAGFLTAYLMVILIHAVSGYTKNQPINLLASAQHTVKNALSLILAYIVVAIPVGIIAVVGIAISGGAGMFEGLANAGAAVDQTLGATADAVKQNMQHVQGLLGIVGILLLVIIYLGTRLYTVAIIIVENNVGPIKALAQGWNQTKGYFWDTLLMAICVGAVSILIMLAVVAVSTVLAMVLPGDLAAIGIVLMGIVSSIILYPLGVAAMTIQKQKLDLVKGQARTAQPTQQTGPTDSSSNL